jgi:hypothetical protein
MRRMLRLGVIVATALLLAGCFLSERPLFAPESGARVFGDGGRYKTYESRDGRFQPDETLTFRAEGSRYVITDAQGKTLSVSFHPVAGGLHVAQVSGGADPGGYGYTIFRIAGDEVFVHAPDCEALDEAALKAHGIVRRGRYECLLDGVRDPTALFAGLTLGAPASKLMRE